MKRLYPDECLKEPVRKYSDTFSAITVVKQMFFGAALLALAGCVTTDGPGSVAGGECKVFEAPRYAIRGATQHDQDWIDPTIESGVGGCKWARPAPRPAEWDATPMKSKQPTVAKPKKHAPAASAASPKGWIWKALPTLARKPAAPAAPAAPASLEVAAAPAVPPPPAPPRSAIDVLLHPEAASK